MRRFVLSLLAVFLAISSCFAQTVQPQVINTAGGTFNDANSYFRVDWSVGELALVNQMQPTPTSLIITNGFLQPFVNEFDVNSNAAFGAEEIRVFPNPASVYFEINFKTKQKGVVRYLLYNSMGQRLYDKSFFSYGLDRIEKVPTNHLASGTYMLYIELDAVTGSVDKKGSFKIIKVH